MEAKNHKDEQQWSPVVFFDRPRCILCYRCVRVCGEAMDVWALGVQNRGVSSIIAPNKEDHLECEECGMCIDICPVGALTSGAYRYKTRPWEMKHVGTICTHCGDGCKTTLGVRRADTGMEIVRGDNRDKSGTNGDFLCIKGRYAFDFANHEERLTQPLIRRNGKLTPATWEEAFQLIGKKFAEIRDRDGGQAIGVIGSNRTTNEESYLLSKFARVVLKTNNVDHHRTADFPAFSAALRGKPNATATMAEVFTAPAVLLIGNDPTEQHPLLAYQIRNSVRLHRSRLYVVNSPPITLRRQATSFTQIPAGADGKFAAFLADDDGAIDALESFTKSKDDSFELRALRQKLVAEDNLTIIFGSELRGSAIANLVKFGSGITRAKFVCLADYANSRGAADMGLYPDLLPGYHPISAGGEFHQEWGAIPQTAGLDLPGMVDVAKAGKLKALYVVGSNPVGRLDLDPFAFSNTFVVVQDMFLTETAVMADVVLPAANAYEKAGTVTNTCGDVQLVKKAGEVTGTKPDFEMIVRIADAMGFDLRKLVPFGSAGTRADMGQTRGAQSGEADRHAVWLEANGLEPKLSPFDPMAILDEIQRLVPGYGVSRMNLLAGNSEHTTLAKSGPGVAHKPESISPAHDNLFSSGTLGRYSRTLKSVIESHEVKPAEVAAD
jgi:NADH-quinone oxidoreductase subunit G